MGKAIAAIRTRGLEKRFGEVRAVDGIELEVRSGEIYGFLGRNGAGKTTTIRMLLGLMRPSDGTIEIFGKDVERQRKAALQGIGFLVEDASAYPNLTVRENLELQRSLTGAPRASVGEAIELLSLGEYGDRKASQLSLGNKQRLSVARALLAKPRLLVLDEPANSLDPAGIAEMRALLRRLADSGTTVFMSSHILGEVDLLADRIGIVHKGKLVEELDREEMAKRDARIIVGVDAPEKARNLIGARFPGASATIVDSGSVRVEAGKGEPLPEPSEIAKLLVGSGLLLDRLAREEEGLEERFMRLTGGAK